MNAQGQRVDVLAVMQLAADMLDTGEFEVDRETGRQLEAAIPLVAELIERDRIATEIFTCILRGVNDLGGSMGYRSQQFVPGWLQQWAKSMHAAGFKPLDPNAKDIANALARVGGAQS